MLGESWKAGEGWACNGKVERNDRGAAKVKNKMHKSQNKSTQNQTKTKENKIKTNQNLNNENKNK